MHGLFSPRQHYLVIETAVSFLIHIYPSCLCKSGLFSSSIIEVYSVAVIFKHLCECLSVFRLQTSLEWNLNRGTGVGRISEPLPCKWSPGRTAPTPLVWWWSAPAGHLAGKPTTAWGGRGPTCHSRCWAAGGFSQFRPRFSFTKQRNQTDAFSPAGSAWPNFVWNVYKWRLIAQVSFKSHSKGNSPLPVNTPAV